MKSIYVALYFIYSIFAINIFLPELIIAKLKKDIRGQYLVAAKLKKWWGIRVFNSTGSTVEVIGSENIPPKDETILLVSNHQSNFDVPLVSGWIDVPFGLVAKKELGKIPSFSYWMRVAKCVFIDRNNPRKSVLAIEESINNIKNGYSQGIFPEGTRSRSSKMGEFKHGSLKIATKTGCTILPVTIDGTYKIFEETGRIKKSHVKLTIHKPIKVSELDEETKKNLASYVQNIIESALNKN